MMEFFDWYLMWLRNVTNWILWSISTIWVLCLIVWIIMIVTSKKKGVKKWGIIMVCILPTCVVLWFIVSIVFYLLWAGSVESLEQEVVSNENGVTDIEYK